jgi:hypothetical protein
MKRFFCMALISMFASTTLAAIPVRELKNPPQGTFKKTRSGKIVQYDKKGKKIGVYKLQSGTLVRVK